MCNTGRLSRNRDIFLNDTPIENFPWYFKFYPIPPSASACPPLIALNTLFSSKYYNGGKIQDIALRMISNDTCNSAHTYTAVVKDRSFKEVICTYNFMRLILSSFPVCLTENILLYFKHCLHDI